MNKHTFKGLALFAAVAASTAAFAAAASVERAARGSDPCDTVDVIRSN